MAKASTSFSEQVLYYYILKFYPDAINRYKHDTIGELDIYLPREHVAIEYDGSYWHRKKLSLDNEKNKRANSAGVRLIRIREKGLEKTEGAFGEIYITAFNENYSIDHVQLYLKEIGRLLGNHALEAYPLTMEEHTRNLPIIHSKIYDVEVEPNLSKMCGIELWDKKFNKKLSPKCIPKLDWAYAILRCKNGRNMVLPRYHRSFRDECKEYKGVCKNCVSHLICPLIRWCCEDSIGTAECDVVKKQVYNMIEQGIRYWKLEKSVYLSDWLWIKSNLGINLVREILSMDQLDSEREKYYRFFGFRTSNDNNGIITTRIFVKNEEECKLLKMLASEVKYTKIDVMISPRIKNDFNINESR